MTDRLNNDRLEKVVEIFKPTIAERKNQIARAKANAEDQARKQQNALRLQKAASGLETLPERLNKQQQAGEITAQRIARLKREKQDILRQVAQAKAAVARQRARIEAARKAFAQRVEEFRTVQQEEDFKQAVEMLDQLKADQAKRVFQDLLAEGRKSTVIAYLAALPKRTAGDILSAFETPEEIVQARRLIEGLRQRGAKVAKPPFQVNEDEANQPPDGANAPDAAA